MLGVLHQKSRGSNALGERPEMARFAWIDSQISADCKKGRRKGATLKNVKNRQKVSKSFFSTIFAQGKKRQKSSKSVKKFFDSFRQFSRGTIFPAPFGGLWRFTRIAWFAWIFSGFPSCTPSLRIAFRGTRDCELQIWGDSHESLKPENARGGGGRQKEVGGAKPHEETPTEISLRPPSPRYVLPPPYSVSLS